TLVAALDRDRDRGDRLAAMLVFDRIAENDDCALAVREIIEVCARIELDLVAGDRGGALARRRRCRGEGEHRAVVDIGVVGEVIDEDYLVLTGRREVDRKS